MNICDLLERQAERLEDTPCIHHAAGTWSYRELCLRVRVVAAALRRAGVCPGEVVAQAFADELTLLVALLATARMGATAFSLPLNTPSPRRDELLREVGAVWLASDSGDLELPGLASILITLPAGDMAWPDAGQDDVLEVNPQAPWIIASGSGSTGRPKLLPVSHRQQLARMTAGVGWLPYTDRDVFASLIHLDYYASKQRFLEAFAKGASIALMDRRRLNFTDADRVGRVTVLYGTVFHMEQLLASLPATVRGHLESLTALMIGGSTVSTALRATIAERLCRRLYVLYGANESHTTCITRLPEVFDTPGGVGRPHDGVTLQIVGDDDQPLPAGEVGRVRVRGESCIDGYLGDDEATLLAFRDGWFHPGDLGRMTGDGQLVHMGRADDLMIMNGINIYPAEIERTMMAHPAVSDVVALPFAHPVHQDIPVCAVVPAADADIAEPLLLAWIRERLGAQSPHRVFILDAIPRNDQGKPVRADILGLIAVTQQRDAAPLPAATTGVVEVPPMRARKQLDYRIRFAWHMPGQADPAGLDIWLEQIMANDLGGLPEGSFRGGESMPPDSRAWLWRCLQLARLLLQGAGAPVFDAPRIIACEPAAQGGGKWDAIVLFPLLDDYPNDLYSSALGFAFRLAAWAAGRAPDTENLEFFAATIARDFLEPARQRVP
ncbi:MAG: long-chain fatty acid--CoA ligase, partial [Bacteroidales bacterium]|nr:long-chain fatty acid--CoA ligase [Bacteroidales bacterium]